MKEIKALTFDEVLKLARDKAEAFAKLPEEEKAAQIKRRDEILAKLGGSGPTAFYMRSDNG